MRAFKKITALCFGSLFSPAWIWALRPDLTKQTLSFRDRRTGVTVHIIGTMHYNPHSIAKTRAIIRSYGESDRLGSVVVESCDLRWKLVQKTQPAGSCLRAVLDNEFQAAAEAGEGFTGSDAVLADEDVGDNDARINRAFLSSVRDWLDPFGGGWTAISDDILRGYAESVDPASLCEQTPPASAYLDRSDLLDPGMLRGAPVSLARYALAILIRTPRKGILLLGWIGLLVGLLATRGFDGLTYTEGALASAAGFALSLSVGLPLLGRVYLVALLGERNEILAKNIRRECTRLANSGAEDAVCVAVLGLAHCNGAKRVLCE